MSDLPSVLSPDAACRDFTSRPAWLRLRKEFEAGDVGHCRAVSAPAEWHPALLTALARLYLCSAGTGQDACPGCSAWSSGTHPDLLVAGQPDRPPNIDECRTLVRELALRPVSAPRRLGVVPSADRLLLPAANSLLKVAEEPPSHACVLFLLEGGGLLPTLRSRARFTVLAAPDFTEGTPVPEGDAAWLDWLRGQKGPEVPALLAQWATHALRGRDLGLAARADRLRLMAEQGKLSEPMLCDLLILAIKEELPFEHIFDDLW
ncbi:MAG: DNA polymerase III subunit delta' [Fretibacterium sp.]|nr:DNA polymerase III subunit delta' [Fretibacterium sp.]